LEISCCTKVFKVLSHLVFYYVHHIWFYVEVFGPLGLELLQLDKKMCQFALFYMLTTSWTSTICWKCCPFSNGWFSLRCQRSSDNRWVHFWIFNSITLIYLSVSVPAPCSYNYCSIVWIEVRVGDFLKKFFNWEWFLISWVFCYSR